MVIVVGLIDQVQRPPKLFSTIQVIVDEKKQERMYLLTGSHQLGLHEAISQSLASRTGLLELLPLTNHN